MLATLFALCLLQAPAAPASPPSPVGGPAHSDVAAAAPEGPLYRMNESQVDLVLRDLHRSQPDFRQRIVTLARRNLRQPYSMYLLGEAPFETFDDEPVYCLARSDCLVFTEHTVAMALTDNFRDFVRLLQRIRYKDGHVSVFTRNHYTEADWNINNAWLCEDLTERLGGDAVKRYPTAVNRSKFFHDRYKLKLEERYPVQRLEVSYIPLDAIHGVADRLRDGDIVNFVYGGKSGGMWVGHVGLVAVEPGRGVTFIHSQEPAVKQQTIDELITQYAAEGKLKGFKILRIHDDALARVATIDGSSTPKVTVPQDSPVSFEQYLRALPVP
jgi:hypothetical protein